jgi:hypothetical protein
MLVSQIALVSRSGKVRPRELLEVAAALQVQVTRDWSPVWQGNALVTVFEALEDVPPGCWPLMVVDRAEGPLGSRVDRDGQPFALIEAGDSWSLSASQACLEMLVDPSGNRLVSADSAISGQGSVDFLMEICKPTADPRYAYLINGVVVSDFHTPAYFQSQAPAGGQYCFSGAVERPRQVLPGGYLTWRDSTSNRWHQLNFFGQQPEVREMGTRPATEASARTWITAQTRELRRLSHLGREVPVMSAAHRAREAIRKASEQRMLALLDGIALTAEPAGNA